MANKKISFKTGDIVEVYRKPRIKSTASLYDTAPIGSVIEVREGNIRTFDNNSYYIEALEGKSFHVSILRHTKKKINTILYHKPIANRDVIVGPDYLEIGCQTVTIQECRDLIKAMNKMKRNALHRN